MASIFLTFVKSTVYGALSDLVLQMLGLFDTSFTCTVQRWPAIGVTMDSDTGKMSRRTRQFYLRQGGYVFVVVYLSVCLLATLRKNLRTDLHEIFRDGWEWNNEQTTKFCCDPDNHLDTGICFLDSSLLGDTELISRYW